MVTHREINNSLVYLYFQDRAFIGECHRLEDGYFSFLPSNTGGYWSESIIRLVADKLQELNKEWDEKVNSYLNGKEI